MATFTKSGVILVTFHHTSAESDHFPHSFYHSSEMQNFQQYFKLRNVFSLPNYKNYQIEVNYMQKNIFIS